MIAITVLQPQACTSADLEEFKEKVIDGGEVNPDTLPNLLEKALALAFARREDELIGVGAIKCPYKRHRVAVFESAKSPLSPNDFSFELGWFYVTPHARGNGLASQLVQSLMPVLEGRAAYTTSRTNNERMHAALRKAGFVEEGIPYPSKQNDQDIQLFICR